MKAVVIRRLAGIITIECESGETHTIRDRATPLGATITCPDHTPRPPRTYYGVKTSS